MRLLSNDWGGEPVEMSAASDAGSTPQVPPRRALFGDGLLRLWSDNLYARVLASRDTPASREQVTSLGRAIVTNRSTPPVPALVRAMPLAAASDYRLRPERLCFFRSHLVLNGAFFLSSEDILDLNQQVDAVTAQYVQPSAGQPSSAGQARTSVQVVAALYPNAAAATAALTHFRRAYLPEASGSVPDASHAEALKVEQGWAGDAQRGRAIVIALDCPDESTARQVVTDVADHVGNQKGQP